MPPKKAPSGAPSKKTETKKKEKIIEVSVHIILDFAIRKKKVIC